MRWGHRVGHGSFWTSMMRVNAGGCLCQCERRTCPASPLNCLWIHSLTVFLPTPNACGKSAGNVRNSKAELCLRRNCPKPKGEGRAVCRCWRGREWPQPRCFRRAPRPAQDGARGAGGRRGRARAPGAPGAQPAQRGRGTRTAGAVAAAQPLPAAPHRAQEWWVTEGGRERRWPRGRSALALATPRAAGWWKGCPGGSPASAALGAAAATLRHGMDFGRFLSSFKTAAGVCYKY